jgi:TolA-binding protein
MRGGFVNFRFLNLLAAVSVVALVPAPASAQRQPPPTPEQRLDRLERQVQQMQRQVFPKGRPADTAGFSDDPAATQSSVMNLDQRLDALERQMQDLLRASEENGNRLRTVEGDLGKLRTDQDQRISTLEQRLNDAASGAPVPSSPAQSTPTVTTVPAKPKPGTKTAGVVPSSTSTAAGDVPSGASDAGEDAYTQGFKLWEAGQYDQAVPALRAFVAAYPKHRRVSYANNLIGRALLDQGKAQAAASVFLGNYRNNPKGERAPDSLYYLGQALMKLGQPGQACKAYAELDAVYGAKIRPDLKKLEADAKSQAQCS